MHVFPAFEGSTSNQQLVERSKLDKLCNAVDEIRSDNGFNTQDLFAGDSLKITTAKFFKKKEVVSMSTVLFRKLSSLIRSMVVTARNLSLPMFFRAPVTDSHVTQEPRTITKHKSTTLQSECTGCPPANYNFIKKAHWVSPARRRPPSI